MKDGASFPPAVVFHDGAEYFLADGFHRYFAAKKCGSPGLACDVREGTLRDAILFSFSANGTHGLRRTAADKRKAVMAMLEDIEWQDWSDREIARQCCVSHPFVAAIRKEIGADKSEKKMNVRGKTTTRIQQPVEKEEKQVPEFSEEDIEREEMKAVVDYLKKQNEELQDELTVAQASSTDDIQKEKAESIIKDLRAQIRVLEIELKEVTVSRDTYQRENGELKKQVTSLLKKLKKLEG
jgi:predicted RNase H-like nuclease (RuvC/YqgF family)